MFDLIVTADRAILLHLKKRIDAMALDLSKLNSATSRLIAADNAVIAAHAVATDPADQAAVDAIAGALDGQAVKAEAVVATVSDVPTPAPAPGG